MNKKILMGLGAVLTVVASVAAMSAYEAHVINVTAHIENALRVHTTHLDFGTVFPQEWAYETFDIELSSSFQSQDRVDYVDYVINQKQKPLNDPYTTIYPSGYSEGIVAHEYCLLGPDEARTDYYDYCYLNLCPFLSKEDADPNDNNDTEHPSYFQDTYCEFSSVIAGGKLVNGSDILDSWTIDLKVPPVAGFVGQDWPAGCPTVPQDSQDYGCDLWIEVTDIGGL